MNVLIAMTREQCRRDKEFVIYNYIASQIKVTPEKMQSVLQTLMPYLNQSLRNYFNQQPAYVLSEDKSKGEALAKKYAKMW